MVHAAVLTCLSLPGFIAVDTKSFICELCTTMILYGWMLKLLGANCVNSRIFCTIAPSTTSLEKLRSAWRFLLIISKASANEYERLDTALFGKRAFSRKQDCIIAGTTRGRSFYCCSGRFWECCSDCFMFYPNALLGRTQNT